MSDSSNENPPEEEPATVEKTNSLILYKSSDIPEAQHTHGTTNISFHQSIIGTSLEYARADHQHLCYLYQKASTSMPLPISTTSGSIGSSELYAREDHQHLFNLTPPIKIFDETGNLKKIILNQTITFTYSSTSPYVYFKFPSFTRPSDILFDFICVDDTDITPFYSIFHVRLKYNDSNLRCVIDNSENYLRISGDVQKVVAGIIDGYGECFYVKLELKPLYITSIPIPMKITYLDIYSTYKLPSDFKYTDMMRTEPTGNETDQSGSTSFLNTNLHPLLGIKTFILNNSASQNPSITNPAVYKSTFATWDSAPVQVGSGVYAWGVI
jgi:hypothetical protein